MSYYGTVVTTGVHSALPDIRSGRRSTGPLGTRAEAVRLGTRLLEGRPDVQELRLQITEGAVGVGTYKMVGGNLIRA
jgi:hypothetical protein